VPNALTAQERKRGTYRADRDVVRSLPEIQAEIKDAFDCVATLRNNLTMANAALREKGMYIESVTRNNKGETVTTLKLNPAFRVQAAALSGLKSWKRTLALLREEGAAAQEAANPEKDEFEGL